MKADELPASSDVEAMAMDCAVVLREGTGS
jgi:hypothetical protein